MINWFLYVRLPFGCTKAAATLAHSVLSTVLACCLHVPDSRGILNGTSHEYVLVVRA